MSLYDYLFDSEYKQRHDIEVNRTTTSDLSSNLGNVTYDVTSLKRTVHELSATVHVLVQMLAERGGLDLEAVKARVSAELHPPLTPGGPSGQVTCVRCNATGPVDKMVTVGSSIWCRNCAANP